MAQENLNIELGIYGEYTTERPVVSIYLDDKLLERFTFQELSKKTITKKFNVSVDVLQQHELSIEFLNRPDNGTVRHMHTKQILSVMQVVVNKMLINGVNCLAFAGENLVYYPQDPNKPFIRGITYISKPGVLRYTFNSPFFFWALQNI